MQSLSNQFVAMDGEHGYKAGELNQIHGRRLVCTVQANCMILPAQIRSVRLVETRSRRKEDMFSFLGAADGIEFGGLRITALLFADHVVLLASSGEPLQLVLGQFAAKCEVDRGELAPPRLRTWFFWCVLKSEFPSSQLKFSTGTALQVRLPTRKVEATPPAPI